MAQIPIYKNFDEKKEYFKIDYINTISELDNLIIKVENNKGSIWRGVCESKYKLYTSLQKFWIERELPNDIEEVFKYINHIEEYSRNWHNEFLIKYFNNYKSTPITLFSVLSILRHYETPTPILDWTNNPKIALFFTANSSKKESSNNDIDNYISVFEIKEDHPINKFNYKQIAFAGWQVFEESIRERNKVSKINNPYFVEHFTEAYINTKDIFYNTIRDKIRHIKIEDRLDDKYKFYINNNYRITAQNGLFIINSDPIKPLEESITEFIIRQANNNGTELEYAQDAYNTHINNFFCYEIHKNLKEYLLNKLNRMGINNNYVYPNLYDMAKEATNSFLIK